MGNKQSSLLDPATQDVMRLRPLAEWMRPLTLDEYVGQTRLLGPRLRLETRCAREGFTR